MSVRRKSASSRFVQQPAAQFYDRFVESIKQRIRTVQIKAALAANAQLSCIIGKLDATSWLVRNARGGAQRSSTVLPMTFSVSFQSSLATPLAISSTCAPLPRPGRTVKLCNNLLHKFHGAKIASCSIV